MWFYLPWQPFHNYANWFVDHQILDGRTDPSYGEIAAAAQVSVSKIRYAAREGRIMFHDADHMACKLGVHPSLIWGDMYWQVLNEYVAHTEAQRVKKLQSNQARRELLARQQLVPC